MSLFPHTRPGSGGHKARGPASGPIIGTASAGCLDTGVTVKSGPVEAALGHRAIVLTQTNCGTAPQTTEPGAKLLSVVAAKGDPEQQITVDTDLTFVTRPHGSATVPHRLAASAAERPYDR
ncbi:hypothetical protein [Amycolatopsis sp. cmx-11-51]|uniref:hypothetical protein n=1 Tax=Amycolatopsis sp. cmx-11-51 TaxID=2785797 RepID=UPI0039E3D3E5